MHWIFGKLFWRKILSNIIELLRFIGWSCQKTGAKTHSIKFQSNPTDFSIQPQPMRNFPLPHSLACRTPFSERYSLFSNEELLSSYSIHYRFLIFSCFCHLLINTSIFLSQLSLPCFSRKNQSLNISEFSTCNYDEIDKLTIANLFNERFVMTFAVLHFMVF